MFFRLEIRLYFYLRSTKLLLLVGVVVGFAGSIFEILCNMDLILPSLLSLLSTWSKVPVIKPLSDESFELLVIRFFKKPNFLVYILCPWYLIDFDVSNFKYWMFVIVFFRQGQLKKSKQIFQIDELPRTLNWTDMTCTDNYSTTNTEM